MTINHCTQAIAEREKELWIRSLNGGTKRKDPYGRQNGSKKKREDKVITLSDSDSELTIIDISPRNKKIVVEEIIIDDEDIQVLEEVISLDVEAEIVTLDDSDGEIEVVMSQRRRTSSGYTIQYINRSDIDIGNRSPNVSPDRNDICTNEIHSTPPASEYERMDGLEDIILPSEKLSSTNGTSFMDDQRLYPPLERNNIRVSGTNAKEYCEPSLPEVYETLVVPKTYPTTREYRKKEN